MKKDFSIGILFLTVFINCSYSLFSMEKSNSNELLITELITHFSSIPQTQTISIDHSQWDKLLKKYVDKEGYVNYVGFQKDVHLLDSYLEILSKNPPNENWSVEELLAYYINLYNAASVKLIVDEYPVKSIANISRPWTKSRISIGNKMFSLDDIEHNILRKMNEPRIHFALNCASISCPKLLNEAYTSSKINEQLERVTKEFINSDKNDISSNNAKVSAIFKWYVKDFKVNGKTDVINFINQYSYVKMNPDAKVMFKKYNWDLNEVR